MFEPPPPGNGRWVFVMPRDLSGQGEFVCRVDEVLAELEAGLVILGGRGGV
jgi:hypothetical protein